jgi:hypothetical protein
MQRIDASQPVHLPAMTVGAIANKLGNRLSNKLGKKIAPRRFDAAAVLDRPCTNSI